MPDYKNELAGIEMLLPWSDFIKERRSGLIEQLAKVFVDCDEFGTFDMLSGDYEAWAKTGDILLTYRVSTEFPIEQRQSIFDRIYNTKIQYDYDIVNGTQRKGSTVIQYSIWQKKLLFVAGCIPSKSISDFSAVRTINRNIK